jgi:hypothetical protein
MSLLYKRCCVVQRPVGRMYIVYDPQNIMEEIPQFGKAVEAVNIKLT